MGDTKSKQLSIKYTCPVLSVTGGTYFRTAAMCKAACISKNTFLRWVKDGICTDVKNRDRRGWRPFSEEEVDRLKGEANRINQTN